MAHNSQILGSGIPQERTADGTPANRLFRPHLMQGWSPDFIPKLTEDAVTMKTIDKVIPVSGDDALRLSKALASEEGIFVGISAGANRSAKAPRKARPYSACCPIEAPADAVKFLNDTVSDPDEPVVLFALEWCEFCWSLRKMFAKYEIPHRSVDLDSVVYQEDNKGGKIRAALRERTGSKTIPQVFVGGHFIGGATELFDSQEDGKLAELLEKNSVAYNKDIDVDPYTFLPGWLQQR